jgi:hypothetical protein
MRWDESASQPPHKSASPRYPKKKILLYSLPSSTQRNTDFCYEMNFIRRILKPYTTGISSIDPISTPIHLSIDPVSIEKLDTINPMPVVADSRAMDVKMEMEIKREVANGNLHGVPALVDKQQRKAAKKQRRNDARMRKERPVLGGSGRPSGVGEGNSAQRKTDGELSGVAVAAMVKRKQKKQAKKQRRREAAAKQVQTNIAELEERTALYAVPYHL